MELGPMQQKFVDALRSGEYTQGRLQLYNKNSDSYCCLGVANVVCDLKESSDIFLDNTYEQLGLRNRYGSLHKDIYVNTLKYVSLLEMNDTGQMSFKDIANFIEGNPELVFTRSV
jgi:hypothetical protein